MAEPASTKREKVTRREIATRILNEREQRAQTSDLDNMYDRGIQYGLSVAARIARGKPDR